MRRSVVAAVLVLVGLPSFLAAQTDRCQIRFVSQGSGGFATSGAGEINWVSGGVTLSCIGQNVRMTTDSAVRYPSGDVELVGSVRYRDSTVAIAAQRATFRRAQEVWEARGAVEVRNLETGSIVSGPVIDYYRAAAGLRDSAEVYATGRPRVQYFDSETPDTVQREPYLIVGDRLRSRGKSLIWAGGSVTIDRSDLSARADSMRLDTGLGDDGTLIGRPVFRGLGPDSFTVRGHRIDFAFSGRDISSVLAQESAQAVRGEWTVRADTIALALAERVVQRLNAWSGATPAHAASAEYDVRGDSIVVETPDEVLRSLHAFGGAWLGGAVDSTVNERDWLAGDTVRAAFRAPAAPDSSASRLERLMADGNARSFQVVEPDAPGGRVGFAYVTGDAIIVSMAIGEGKVDHVEVRGQVHGVQLHPAASGAP